MATQDPTVVVEVRVSATLRRRLPAFEGRTAVTLCLAPGATAGEAARALGIDLGAESLLCVVNGKVAEASDKLDNGDQVRLMHRIAGGSQASQAEGGYHDRRLRRIHPQRRPDDRCPRKRALPR